MSGGRSRVVKDWLWQNDGRVWLERLPGYAPDLNPDEGVWNHLKHVQLVNVCKPGSAHPSPRTPQRHSS
ncbi:MAG: transposase [Planctomycetales bacterium]|nr:transposase [Planctomycetales bacterium]